MEMFELRYFVAVAQFESVARAAQEIHVSAAALSKAVGRLEDEVQAPLFFKSGRGIRLTPEGQLLKKRAQVILRLEEDARLELVGPKRGRIQVSLSGEEVLQGSFGLQVAAVIEKLLPEAQVRFMTRPDAHALAQVEEGEVHLALTTSEPPSGLQAKVLARVEFQTCAGQTHPLVKKYHGKKAIDIAEVLQHGFVIPESALLGRVKNSQSLDGWRDDKFPRRLKYRAGGLKLLENLLHRGQALAYLPDYFVAQSGLEVLRVSGCPYSCSQTVRVVAKNPDELGWLGRVWEKL